MEIKDLPQLEEATESDHVVSSISQKTRLISFKNILEKISFSSLVTTAKNIIGSINELKGRCDSLDTSVSKLNTDLTNGYKLYYGTETVNVTANTNKSVSINKPSGWSKIIGAVVSGNTNPYTIDYSSVKPVVADSGVTIIISNPTASGEFKIGYLLFGV